MNVSKRLASVAIYLCALISSGLLNPAAANEPFSPNRGEFNVSTGAGNYRLPFDLPPAPGRLEPRLGISYSDRASHGLFGARMHLAGMPSISRCGPKKVMGDPETNVVTATNADRLCLNGNQLRSVTGSYWGQGSQYRTVIDSYTRVTAISDGFRVEFKDGTAAILNKPVSTEQGMSVHSWHPTRIEDTYGNTINFTYLEPTLRTRLSEALPSTMSYGNTEISFSYRDGYQIAKYFGTSSDLIKNTKVISAVQVKVANQPIRKYQFQYGSGVPNRSLETVEECGVDEPGSVDWQCANLAAFEWEENVRSFEPEIKRSVVREQTYGDGTWLVDVHTADFTGNGIQDLITISAGGRVVLHKGGADTAGNLRLTELLPRLSQDGSSELKVRTAFATGDITHNGRSEIIFAEGEFNTRTLTGTYEWRVITQRDNGSARTTTLYRPGSTTVSMNNGGPNESAFFTNFFNNVGIGVKPVVADVTGNRENEIVFPQRQSSTGDRFSWSIYSSNSGLNLTKVHDIDQFDASDFPSASAVRVVGDGTQQLLFAGQEYGSKQWKLYHHKDGQDLRTVYPVQEYVGNCDPFFFDYQGDGLTDIVFACDSDSSATVFVSNGVRWVREHSQVSGLGNVLKGSVQIADIDGDGRDRLFVPPGSGSGNWRAISVTRSGGYISSDSGIPYTLASTDISSPGEPYGSFIDIVVGAMDFRNQAIQFADYTGNGVVDVVQANADTNRWNLYLSERDHQHHIKTFTDGFENTTLVERSTLADENVYESSASTSAEFREAPLSISVVSKVARPIGSGEHREFLYEYNGARVHLYDLGFTGFTRVIRHDQAAGERLETDHIQEYPNSQWFLNGRPSISRLYSDQQGGSGPVRISGQNWASVSATWGVNFIYPQESYEVELDGYQSVAAAQSITREVDPDNGVVTRQETVRGGASLQYATPSINSVEHRQVVERVGLIDDTQSWQLGFVGSETETWTDANQNQKSQRVDYTRYPGTMDVARETRHVGNPDLQYTIDYEYDQGGNLVRQSESGNSNFKPREWSYSNFVDGIYPRVRRSPLGHDSTNVSYDARYGKIRSSTDANGLTRTSRFDAFGREVEQVQGDGTVITQSYQRCNASCSLPSAAAHVPFYKVTTTTTHPQANGDGAPTEVTYFDSLNRKIATRTTGFDGTPIYQLWTYDAQGRQLEETRPFKGSQPEFVTRYLGYDYADRPRDIRDEFSNGQLARKVTVNYDYMSPGMRTTRSYEIRDESGSAPALNITEIEESNARGNTIHKTEAAGTAEAIVTEFRHDAHDNLVWARVDNDDSTILTRAYDAAGNLLREDDPNAGVRSYGYDALGNLLHEEDGKGQRKEYEYDERDRLVSRADVGEQGRAEALWYYDHAPQCDQTGTFVGAVCLAQSAGFTEKYSYDGYGRLETTGTAISGSPVTGTQSFARVYDAFGREAARSYPNEFAVLFDYNTHGYLSSIADTEGTPLKTIQSEDAFGNATRYQLGNGLSVEKDFSASRGLVTRINTPGIQQDRYHWFGNGTLAARSSLEDSASYHYDALNRLTLHSYTSHTGGNDGADSYSYDRLGNLLTKPDASAVQYARSGNAGPHAATSAVVNTSAVTGPVPEYSYSQGTPCPEGGNYRDGKCHYEPGILAAIGHQYVENEICGQGQILNDGQCHQPADFNCSLHSLINVGGAGEFCGTKQNVSTWHRFWNGLPACAANLNERDVSFRLFKGTTVTCYDTTDLYVQCPAGSFRPSGADKRQCLTREPVAEASVNAVCVAPGTSGNSHDPDTSALNGQCWHLKQDVQPSCPSGFGINDGKDLAADWQDEDACFKVDYITPGDGGTGETTLAYAYDQNGNMIRRGDHSIDYTVFDKPSRIESDIGITTFRYGPERSRYLQATPSGTTAYIGGQYELVQNGSEIREISYVGNFLRHERVADQNSYRYLHRDHLESVAAITDGAGNLLSRMNYAPFGSRSGDVQDNDRGFTDHEHLSESGLIHMNGRVYDPVIGRFLSPDPFVQAPYRSQNYNRYSYVLNNPLSLVDPSGYIIQETVSAVGKLFESWGLNEYRPITYAALTPYDNYWANEGAALVSGFQNALTWAANSGLATVETASWTPAFGLSLLTGESLERSDQSIMAAMMATPFTAGSYRGVQLTRASRYISVTREAGSIRNVNAIGGRMNCVNCVIATDATLAGRPASALAGGPFRIDVLENTFGGRFGAPGAINSLSDRLSTAGPGARGIVFGSRGSSEVGHVFNAVNQNGVVRFLDGQTGRAATLEGFESFQLLRTN
jgi:RHS repeat-associated protein